MTKPDMNDDEIYDYLSDKKRPNKSDIVKPVQTLCCVQLAKQLFSERQWKRTILILICIIIAIYIIYRLYTDKENKQLEVTGEYFIL